MDSEKRSPRQWARDIMSPTRMITLVGWDHERHDRGRAIYHILNKNECATFQDESATF